MNTNDFINSIDNKLYNKIRQSKSDAECRRYLKEHLEAITVTHCCKSDSELLPKYWQIKKEFITPELKKRFPSIIEWAFEKEWWINNNIAKEEELEPLSV